MAAETTGAIVAARLGISIARARSGESPSSRNERSDFERKLLESFCPEGSRSRG